MIAVDTSALMAILLNESQADECDAALNASDLTVISAGTLTEALIVAGARNVRDELEDLVERLNFQIVHVDAAAARRAAAAHARWSRGRDGLNFGDCFAYDVAKQNRCPLLYVGRDFAKTDIKSVL